ncbi:MEGF10_11 [Mytilus edulis]|uniref:MEGF10_11 n=1 Tax=Mytilus edulis TaxID=6550 RepID=A0A8S3R779_MYTED|nr:MEGF10_11 [Mytilus edulis]
MDKKLQRGKGKARSNERFFHHKDHNSNVLKKGNAAVCEDGFFSIQGGSCQSCTGNLYGERCLFSCQCTENQICDNINGCISFPSTRGNTIDEESTTVTTWIPTFDDKVETKGAKPSNGYPNIEQLIYKGLILLIVVSLVIFSLTCFCWKYELSCKNRWQGTDHTNRTHTNESGNYPPQGETQQYDEVDDVFLNQESSVNDEHDVRNSGSSTGGSGICGVDGDGYLNPYHALNSIEITIGQGTSSEQSSTETSYIQAQENTVSFQNSEKLF